MIHPCKKKRYPLFTGVLFILLWWFSTMGIARADDTIVVQLKWYHQFQFAGFYAAIEKGFYADAGLTVRLQEGGPDIDIAEELFSGRATYLVTGPSALLDRTNGKPIVALAAIFQHSPLILLTRIDSGITSPSDLVGKRVMYTPVTDPEFIGMIKNEGIDLNTLIAKPHSWTPESLILGETDAMTAYITNEPYYFHQTNSPYAYIKPLTYGIDFYGDCLYTTDNEVKKHTDRVTAFLNASFQGWDYAMDHPGEMIDLLMARYHVKKDREHLEYEAGAMENLILPKLIPIGHMNPGRWKHIADTFVKLNMLSPGYSIEGFIYDPDVHPGNKNLIAAVWILSGVVLLIIVLTASLFFFNRKLNKSVAERTQHLSMEIAERVRAEKALLESEEKYRLLIENQTDLLVKVDLEGRIQFISPSYCRMFGKTDAQLIGRKFFPRIHPDDLVATKEAVKNLYQAPYTAYIEQRTMTKEGWKWLAWINNAVLDDHHTVVSIIGSGRDITEQKNFELALNTSQETFLSVLDGIDATVYVSDMETYEILFMNKYMKDLFETDLTGKKCWSVFRGKSAPCDFCTNKKLLDEKGEPTGVYIWNDKNPLTQRWYINHDRAIKWTDNRYVRLQIATDITDLKSMENDLRQAHKMESIGTLAGGIAHDFNNILGIIIGNAELALADTPEGKLAHGNIQEIKTASLRAKDVVRQLLNFSRKTKHEQTPLDIIPVIKESLKLIKSSIPSTIEIRESLPHACSTILANATQIHQVMINLCTNASHAMPDTGGVIEISLNTIDMEEQANEKYKPLAPGHYLELMVRDNGPGIDSKTREKIFDPYFTTKDVGKGTGMGLAIVHGIVKNHNASIYVDSSFGKGTAFTILFPAIDALPESESELEDKTYPHGTETILFVDDEKSIVDLTEQVLKRIGYTVVAKTCPMEALSEFEAHPDLFDLVISDMTMPGMNGVKLSEKLRQIRPDLPIIICTGYSAIIDEERAKSIGISAYAMKPISMSQIARIIRSVLDG